MKYLTNKNGFLGIDNKFNFKEKVVIVPFGLEKTVSYGGGTKNGPKEIIKASHQVELYDEELNCEPYKKIGIKTLKPFKIDKNIKKALKKMSNINEKILEKKLFPMTFGGEHSITPGCIAPFVKKHKNLFLLHFDAHADLRESYIQNILRNARNNSSRIYCQCKGILAPVPMSSCLRNGNYYLKTLKNQEHGSQCRYFKQSINTSNCNSKQAVIITENNGLNRLC